MHKSNFTCTDFALHKLARDLFIETHKSPGYSNQPRINSHGDVMWSTYRDMSLGGGTWKSFICSEAFSREMVERMSTYCCACARQGACVFVCIMYSEISPLMWAGTSYSQIHLFFFFFNMTSVSDLFERLSKEDSGWWFEGKTWTWMTFCCDGKLFVLKGNFVY